MALRWRLAKRFPPTRALRSMSALRSTSLPQRPRHLPTQPRSTVRKIRTLMPRLAPSELVGPVVRARLPLARAGWSVHGAPLLSAEQSLREVQLVAVLSQSPADPLGQVGRRRFVWKIRPSVRTTA